LAVHAKKSGIGKGERIHQFWGGEETSVLRLKNGWIPTKYEKGEKGSGEKELSST